jgi:predicted nuclease of predicted toxin-antitoxin system
MTFAVDIQLPVRLAIFLRERGHDCVHLTDVGMESAADELIWKWCQTHGRVLISKDEDFVFLASRMGDGGKLLWVRLGNCRTRELLGVFSNHLDDVVGALESGQRVVELW